MGISWTGTHMNSIFTPKCWDRSVVFKNIRHFCVQCDLWLFINSCIVHTVGIVCPPKEASVRYTMVTFPLWLGFHLESLLNFICMSRPDKKMLLAINRVVNFRYPLIFFHTPIHNIQHHQKTRGAIIGIRFCCGLQLSKLYYQLIKVIN